MRMPQRKCSSSEGDSEIAVRRSVRSSARKTPATAPMTRQRAAARTVVCNTVMTVPSGKPTRERRHVERRAAIVPEPAQVGGEERAQVRYAVFQHREPVETHAEREALVFFRVEPAVCEHVRMHHAAAENLEPLPRLADRLRADVDLHRGLREGKVRGAKAHR